jgi:hypothetical protein
MALPDSRKAAGESGIRGLPTSATCGKRVLPAHRLTRAYSSTQTTFPFAWLQNWILPVHLSRRWTPIDDETTCHRRRKAIETIIRSTATMTVIGERFTNDPSLRRVTGTWRYSLRTWLLSDHPRSRLRSFSPLEVTCHSHRGGRSDFTETSSMRERDTFPSREHAP